MEYEHYNFYTYVCLNPDLKEALVESSPCATSVWYLWLKWNVYDSPLGVDWGPDAEEMPNLKSKGMLSLN